MLIYMWCNFDSVSTGYNPALPMFCMPKELHWCNFLVQLKVLSVFSNLTYSVM